MSWLRRLLGRLGDWFRPRYRAEFVDELPDELQRRRVYLVGEDREPWQAALICPCGCEAIIQLSLVARDDPSWRAEIDHASVISLKPSVWRIKDCRAHFFVQSGRIIWARGTGLALPPTPVRRSRSPGSVGNRGTRPTRV